jgi:hypothetical protein
MKTSTKKTLPPACIALAAVLLFGASTPAAKLLIGQVHPQLLAGLLYFGSGLGLLLVGTVFKAFQIGGREPNLRRADLLWLAGAIIFGGVAGPSY